MEAVLRIFRGDREDGRVEDYRVPLHEGMVVLDAIHYVQAHHASDLACRWNCKAGRCGSCSAEVNGKPKLMCMTRMDQFPAGDPITVSPLKAFPVIKDLVSDLTHIAAQYQSIRPWVQTASAPPPDREFLQSVEEREQLDGLWECILCFCCSTACPSYWWNGERYLGPAILLQAYRWIADSRDEKTGERLDELEDPFRLYRCHTIMNCTKTCPKSLNPAKAIAEIKKMMVERTI